VAIYHLNAKFVKRSKGQSAVAKAAYNSHDLLTNANTGDRHDYRYKGDVAFSGIFTPKDAPKWVKELAHDRQALWSAVEQAETRKDSRLAKEIEIALPHELTDKEREWLVKDFVHENCTRHGLIADVAIHAPSKEGDARNHHVHILLTTREIGQDGFGGKLRHLDSRQQLSEWREKWENLANRHLKRHGHAARIDHRTLEAQGIDREPTIHVGPTATDFEREGVKTERGDLNRSVETRNQQRERLKRELKDNERLENALLRPVSKNAAQIREAFQQTEGGGNLAAALKERGFVLSAVSGADAQESQRQKEQYLEANKEIKTAKPPPSVLKKGELVVVNEYGDMYRLNEYTTGLHRGTIEERLKKEDRANLPSVQKAKEAARQHQQAMRIPDDSAAAFLKHQAREREEKNAARLKAAQQAPEKATKKREDRKTNAAVEKGAEKTTHVAGRLTGGFLKAVDSMLDFFVGAPPPRKYTPAELARDPAARRENYTRQAAEQKAAQQRNGVLDRWSEQLKESGNDYSRLSADDVRYLSGADLENIRAHNQDAVWQIVREREKEKERELGGGGRERER
jgi:hypothetical protein